MIYLFNQTEELIDVIDEASLIGFTHTIEINQFDRSNFEIPVDYKPDIIKQAQFFGFQSRGGAFCLFKIAEKSYNVGLSIEGIDRAESDLHSFIIEDKRPGGTADQVLNVILERTGYQLGDKNGLTITGNLSLYYISARQALVKLIEAFGCEFRTRYTFVENKIIGRYIDLYQRFGKVTGHQFEYGSNILNVTYEEDADDVVTALIGRGKGEAKTDSDGEATGGYGRRIQFTDVVWSKAKGDPTDKPAGQNYVTNETSKNIYGLHQNGVIKHRFGVYTNENIDNPVELLKATYKELQRVSVPITTFKANLLDLTNEAGQDMWIGDSVAIVRDQIGIAFEARIHKLKIDKLDENRSAVELGDYETLKEKDRSSRRQALNTLMEGFNESAIEKAIADEAARMDQEFDEKIRVSKLGFDNAVEAIKAKAEENKQALSDEINRRFHDFSPAGFEEAKAKAEEALKKVGASSALAEEAKYIADQNSVIFAGLADKVNKQDDKLASTVTDLKRYSREETQSQITQRFQDFTRDNEAKLAEYKQGIDGRLTTLASQIAGNVTQADFQRVRETSQLYERILGRTDSNVASNIARMALTSELFEVEVGKRFSNLTNLFYAPTKIPKYISSVATDKHLERVSWGDHDGIRINYTDSMSGWMGVRFPLTKKFVKQGESLGYRIEIAVDKVPRDGKVLIQLLDNTSNLNMYCNYPISITKTGNQVFTGYLDIPSTGELNEYSLRFVLTSPGNIVIHKPMIVDKRIIPNEFIDSTDYNNEYNRVTMSLMKDSFAIKSLNSAGDIIAGINVGANGNNRIVGKATHITGETLIDNAVIKSAMIDKLKTANFEAGSVTTNILGAEAVTADKVKIDTALIQKLVSQQAFVDELFSKKATITKIQSVDFTGSHIKGGVLTSLNGNSTFDLNAGQIRMQSGPTSWKTSWDANGLAFRGPGNDVWGAMGGDSGGGVGIYMRGDHAFNLVVNHSDYGPNYSYTALRVKYGEGTTLQFSPGGPSYNLLTLFRTIFNNFRYNESKYYDMK